VCTLGRFEWLPALTLWEAIQDTYRAGKLVPTPSSSPKERSQRSNIYDILAGVDYVPANLSASSGKTKLIIAEDSDAVIKMTVKSRALSMRHVPRTHRVDLDFLFERFREDPSINIRYCETKQMLADMLTKASFTESAW